MTYEQNGQPQTYNDYVFWTRAKGDVLSIESLPSSEAEGHARELAREYKATVSYGIVLDYFIEPVFCTQCGEVMPENGTCPCSRFEEEEARPTLAEMMEREAEIRTKIETGLYGRPISGSK